MSEKQCPNCGGYKLTQKSYWVDKDTGDRIENSHVDKRTGKPLHRMSIFWIFLLPCIVLLVTFWIMKWLVEPQAALTVAAIAGFLMIPIFGREKPLPNAREKIAYNCTLCGWQGSFAAGAPWPTVTVKPDLIAKGACPTGAARRATAPAARVGGAGAFSTGATE